MVESVSKIMLMHLVKITFYGTFCTFIKIIFETLCNIKLFMEFCFKKDLNNNVPLLSSSPISGPK